MLNDFHLPTASGNAAKQAVIFLHGLGDSGSGGLLSIGEIWQAQLMDCAFHCPDAPFAYDMAPGDFGGRQWFSLQSFTREAISSGVEAAAPLLNAYIDHILATYQLTPDRLALVGFSQGTMMALYTALRRPQPLACILGYSGMLVGGDKLVTEKRCAPPVLLVHGQMDEVVPYPAMDEAEQGLKAAGVPVTTLTCPHLGHSIDNAGIAAGLRFLSQHLTVASGS